jgi:FtsZ-binding cell division protein ZapB
MIMTLAMTTTATTISTIKCAFTMTAVWQSRGPYYMCQVQNRDIFRGQSMTIASIEGAHLPGMTDHDVQAFFLNGAHNLNQIPANLSGVFPNLVMLSIDNSKITDLTSDDLKPFPKLKYFIMTSSLIEVIRGDLFAHTPRIEVIDFRNSHNLEHIDPRTFSGLKKLRNLALVNPNCRSLFSAEVKEATVCMVRMVEAGECLSPFEVSSSSSSTSSSSSSTSSSSLPWTSDTTLLSKMNQQLDQETKKLNQKIENLQLENQNYKNAVHQLVQSMSSKSDQMDKNIATIVEKLTKFDTAAAITQTTRLMANCEHLSEKFSNFSSVHEQLDEKNEQLRVKTMQLNYCDAKVKELSYDWEMKLQQLLGVARKASEFLEKP